MDLPKLGKLSLASNDPTINGNGIGEGIRINASANFTTPTPGDSKYPEFAHLNTTNFSKPLGYPNQYHGQKDGPLGSGAINFMSMSSPSPPPSLVNPNGGVQGFFEESEKKPQISRGLEAAPTSPQPYASAEPILSTPVNALIRNCYKQSTLKPPSPLSVPKSTPSPGVPPRSYKRLVPNGKEIGELFDKWGSTPPIQQFERHFEMAEWINMLKDKADHTVEEMQKPPLPSEHSLSSTCSASDCEKATQPYRCPYLVMRLAPKDDVDHMPAWKRRIHKTTPLSSLFAIGCYWLYFSLRIIYTISAQRAVQTVFALSWVFIVVEIGVTLPAMFHQFWQCFVLKSRKRQKLRLISDFTPTVDVFITCCSEENDVILDTVRAALAVSWPISRFRVVVLDDGDSPSLQAEIETLSKTFANVHYTARQKLPGVPHHFKAGNLNHGLKFVEGLKGGAAEFCAALDADMIPEPEWLRTVIAHMVIDGDMALACPPQLFYNVPKNDPITQSLNSFVHSIESIKDTAGVAWCTGSGYAIRRCAIDQLGGFPTGSLAEDVCTSSMLLGAGWKTAYVHEPLQFGTVPDSYLGHIKQRTRWSIGTIQTSIKLNFFLFGPLVREMTLLQRLCGFLYAFSSFSMIFVTLSLLIMPIGVISGFRIVAFANYAQLRWLIRAFFLVLLVNRINEWTSSLPAGYRLGRRDSSAMLWMAPYYAITIVRAFVLPEWLGGKTATFVSTGGIHSSLSERNRQHRAPLLIRLKVILWNYRASMHLFYIIFCVAAIAASITRAVILPGLPNNHNHNHNHNNNHNNNNNNNNNNVPNTTTTTIITPSAGSNDHSRAIRTLVYLLTHTFWPPLLMWVICMFACFAPISYAISPPSMPEREDLLERDKQGIARPKKAAKEIVWGRWIWFHEALYSFLSIYTTVIFVGSWFY